MDRCRRTQNTPPEIIDKLNKEVNAALADPKLKLRLADLGSSVAGGSAADYGGRLEEEAEKWGKGIRGANIKAGGSARPRENIPYRPVRRMAAMTASGTW